jgi:predicted flap endonuclease-1-like 5' DNA nuclease
MNLPNQIAAERMFLNAAKTKVLPEGHKDCAFLYASKGDEIPAEACERFKIKDGKAPAKKPKSTGNDKGGSTPANKGGNTPANKGGSKPADKAKADAKDGLASLTALAGIGPATAGALVTAGVADAAALAAVDPENPPTLETTPPNFDWATVVAAAKAATEAAAQ